MNPIRQLIRDAGGPMAVAKARNLSISAVNTWVAQERIPYNQLWQVGELANYDLSMTLALADANGPTQKMRSARRNLDLLIDLSADTPDFEQIAQKHGTEARLVKGTYTTNKGLIKELVEYLQGMQQDFATLEEKTQFREKYRAKFNVSEREMRRKLARYGISASRPASALARDELAAQRKEKKSRNAFYIAAYVRGSLSADEAAEKTGYNPQVFWRNMRNYLDFFGESPASLKKIPKLLRQSLSVDTFNHVTMDITDIYYPTLKAIYTKSSPSARVLAGEMNLATAHYKHLLPEAINGACSVDEIAAAKGSSLQEVTQALTTQLSTYRLSWTDIEKMDNVHRATLYDLITTRKFPNA